MVKEKASCIAPPEEGPCIVPQDRLYHIEKKLDALTEEVSGVQKLVVELARMQEQRENDRARLEALHDQIGKLWEKVNGVSAEQIRSTFAVGTIEKVIEKIIVVAAIYALFTSSGII